MSRTKMDVYKDVNGKVNAYHISMPLINMDMRKHEKTDHMIIADTEMDHYSVI